MDWSCIFWVNLQKESGILYIHKGILWNIINIFKNIKKRKNVQKTRSISDKELFKIIMKKKSPSIFYRQSFI